MKNSNQISTIRIQGMHCGSCVSKVTKALGPFTEKAEVNLTPPIAKLTNCTATTLEINAALAKVGDYQASKLMTKPANVPPKKWFITYKPLLIILAYILAVSLLIEFQEGSLEPERCMTSIVATAVAHANGWPIYVRPPGNTFSSKVLDTFSLITTPPSWT